jgi:hypothetical protein
VNPRFVGVFHDEHWVRRGIRVDLRSFQTAANHAHVRIRREIRAFDADAEIGT